MSKEALRPCLRTFTSIVLGSLFLSTTAYTQSVNNPPDLVAHLVDLASLVENSGSILVGVDGWVINGNLTMAIDKTTGLITIKSGFSPGSTTSYQFMSSSLGSIEMKIGSGEHSVFRQDANGTTTNADSEETQTANINFNMKNQMRAVQVEVDSPGQGTRTGTGTGVKVIAMSCTKDQIRQMQAAIDEINRLLGAKALPPN